MDLFLPNKMQIFTEEILNIFWIVSNGHKGSGHCACTCTGIPFNLIDKTKFFKSLQSEYWENSVWFKVFITVLCNTHYGMKKHYKLCVEQ